MLSLLASVALATQAPDWREEFVGKPGFGHETRILALPDRLVFLDSPPPTVSDGGDVYVWRDRDPKPRKVFSVSEQGIRTLRQYRRQLFLPGIDALENWDWGNWYLSSDQGETWTKYRNLPKAMHVFDVAQWRGKFYMGICDPEGAVLSSATGSDWKKEFGTSPKDSFAEVLSLVPLPDALYAFWVEQWGAGDREENKKVDCYRFDGKKWEPRKLLPGINPIWNAKVLGKGAVLLLPNRSYWLEADKATPIPALEGMHPAEVIEDGLSLLWLASDAKGNSGVYRSTFDWAKGEVGPLTKVADLPAGLHGESLAIHRDRIYVACGGSPSGKVVSLAFSRTR